MYRDETSELNRAALGLGQKARGYSKGLRLQGTIPKICRDSFTFSYSLEVERPPFFKKMVGLLLEEDKPLQVLPSLKLT